MPISAIADIIEADRDELRKEIRRSGTPASKAYRKGKATMMLDIHTKQREAADSGTPTALQTFDAYVADMEEDE